MVATPPVIATPTGEAESNAGRRLVARAMWIGLWVWPSFVLLDLYMCFVAYEADERSDLYALGVTMHFFLAGVTPYEGLSVEKARFG